MKRLLCLASLALLSACGSSQGTAPVISDFSMESPITSTASEITGTVHVADTAGLTDLSVNATFKSSSLSSSFSVPVEGSDGSVTEADLPLLVELETGVPAGTYDVTITLSQGGAVSNTLSTTVVVNP